MYSKYINKKDGSTWVFRKPTYNELNEGINVMLLNGQQWVKISSHMLVSSRYHDGTGMRFTVHEDSILYAFDPLHEEHNPVENPAKDIQIDESPKVGGAEQYDYINPSHYQNSGKEVWEMMVDVWGVEAFIKHCEMCAFKYRMRLGLKPEQPIERDLSKAEWYEAKAKELRAKLPNSKIAAAGDLDQLKVKRP